MMKFLRIQSTQRNLMGWKMFVVRWGKKIGRKTTKNLCSIDEKKMEKNKKKFN